MSLTGAGVSRREPALVRPTICPPVEPDESVLGYCWRSCRANGRKRMKGLSDYLVARRALQPPWVVPANLKQLHARVYPVFESADDIINRHTLLPALVPFIAKKNIGRLLDHVVNGRPVPGIAAVAGFGGRNIVTRPAMAMCLRCIEADVARLGFAYWHREHQLPGLGVCPQHGIALVAGCGLCQFSHPNNRKARMPQPMCWCGQPHAPSHPPVSDEDLAVLTRMARLAMRLLRGALSGATPERIGAYFHMRAQQAGFARMSYIASEKLLRQIQSAYSPVVMARLNATVNISRNWLAVSIGKRCAPSILGRSLLLFDFFGGRLPTQRDLKQAKAHEGSLASMRDEERRKWVNDFDEGRREEVREELLAFKMENPGVGRTRLIRELGRTAVWARDHDPGWYEDSFPSRKRGRQVQSEEEKAAHRAEFDERTANHIFSRQLTLLLVKGQPKMLTKTLLLKGTPCGNQVSHRALERLPLTKQALELCVDTKAQYRNRYALWLLDNLPDTEDRLNEVQRRTGLSLGDIDRLNYRPGSRPRRA